MEEVVKLLLFIFSMSLRVQWNGQTVSLVVAVAESWFIAMLAGAVGIIDDCS